MATKTKKGSTSFYKTKKAAQSDVYYHNRLGMRTVTHKVKGGYQNYHYDRK